VDDHALFRIGMRNTFSCEYSDICVAGEASDGKQLFALLPDTPADVVLLDINMPGMDGEETTRRLRSDYPAVKILAVSSNDDSQTIEAMIDAGIDGFVSKQNCESDELAEAIRTVYGGLEYYGSDISSIIFGVYVAKKKTIEPTQEFTDREKEIIIACRDGLIGKGNL
jgi:two-component system NarL family response regulator